MIPSATELLHVFDQELAQRLDFEQIPAEDVPGPYHRLLVHDDHMTVAMESYHRGPVDVDVLQARQSGLTYAREILLRRQHDRRVVQYGIVRMDLDRFPEAVRAEVLERGKPLGRILISHDLFRKVELGSLWSVKTNEEFRSRCETQDQLAYARTALIHVNGEPAIELLEAVVNP